MTTILIKKKDTAGAPAAGDLTNAAGGAEIAVNTATKRIYTKDSGGNVVETGTNPSILNVDNIQIDVNTISSTDTNGNINLTPNGTGSVVISKLNVTGAITFDGNVTVGNSSSDTLTINSTITSNLIFTDNTYDIGASGATRPRNLFLAGNATIGGAQTLTGALTVDSTTDSSSTTTGSIQTDGGVGIAKALYVGTSGTIRNVLTVGAASATDAVGLFDSLSANGAHIRLLNSNTANTYFGAAAGISGSGTASDTALRAEGALYLLSGGNNTRVTVTTAGFVGIRTTSPVGFLHVAAGNAAAASTEGGTIVLQAQQGGSSASGGNVLIGSGQNGSGSSNGYLAFGIGSSTSGSAFATGEAARFTTAGNFVIGATAASTKFEVVKQGNSAGGTMMLTGSKTNAATKYGYMTGAHYTSDTYPQGIGIIGCTASSGTNTISIGGDLGEVIAATSIKFWTASNTTTAAGTQRGIFDSSGNLCIGSEYVGSAGTINVSVGNPGVTTGGLQLWSPTSTTHYVQFGDGTSGSDPYRGAVGYNHANDSMVFYTSATLKASLDSSGNFIIGSGSTRASARLDIAGDVMVLGSNPSYYATIDYSAGLGLLSIAAESGGNIAFKLGTSEKARFTSGGYFKASNAGTYNDTAGGYHEFRGSSANSYVVITACTNATPLSEYVQDFRFSAATPNDGNARFWSCTDATAERAYIRSNGGLSNYSANDTNLSDRREKTNFAPAKSYLDIICAIPVQTFNYIDQNHEKDPGLTLGVVAQDVQAVAPELVTESNWGTKDDPKMRLSIYQTDLQYALMKALQELKADFDAYKASHP